MEIFFLLVPRTKSNTSVKWDGDKLTVKWYDFLLSAWTSEPRKHFSITMLLMQITLTSQAACQHCCSDPCSTASCRCADPACTATHIHQSHWFHIDDDRFIIIIPPRMIHSLRRILLPTRAFVFNSREKYLRLALTLWRRHDHFLPFQKPPAWPAKSRHGRATLELNQLSEQLSLLAPPRPRDCETAWRHQERAESPELSWLKPGKLKDQGTYEVS